MQERVACRAARGPTRVAADRSRGRPSPLRAMRCRDLLRQRRLWRLFQAALPLQLLASRWRSRVAQ